MPLPNKLIDDKENFSFDFDYNKEDLDIHIFNCNQPLSSSLQFQNNHPQLFSNQNNDDDDIQLVKEVIPQSCLANKKNSEEIIFLGAYTSAVQPSSHNTNQIDDFYYMHQNRIKENSNPSQILNDTSLTTNMKQTIEDYTLVDPRLETLDPTPSIQQLFEDFDRKFFQDTLCHYQQQMYLQVKWCSRLTTSAGLFSVRKCMNRNQNSLEHYTTQAEIKLSSKLLKFRPRSDLVNTLLHEMIHAYIFFTGIRDDGEHGISFQQLMNQINQVAQTNITIYHSFVQEVQYFKKADTTKTRTKTKI